MIKQGTSIVLDTKRKLLFRQKDLRDVVTVTSKTIGELFDDPFGGWPHLIQHGLRFQDNRVTLDKASEFMDLWVDTPDPETNELRTLDSLREMLLDALNKSNFIKIEKFEPGEKKPVLPEGNV